MAAEGLTELEYLQAVIRRLIEEHFGCPVEHITHPERNEWANRMTTCKREFDAVRNAIGVPYQSFTEQQADIINKTGA